MIQVYAPDDKVETREYGTARYGMEVQRLCSVLENHLKDKEYLVNNEYSIADMAIFPWFRQLVNGYNHSSGVKTRDFLSVDQYVSVMAWFNRINDRPAVQRGVTVCPWDSTLPAKPWLKKDDSEAK